MNILNKHVLEFQPTFEFIKESLSDGNTIAYRLLDVLDFKAGIFFTLLPPNAHIEQLYLFNEYGILERSNVEKEKMRVGDNEFTAVKRPSIDIEIFHYINRYNLKNKTSSLFEDVIQKFGDLNLVFFKDFGIHYKEELYYLITPEITTEEILLKAMNEIFCFYHGLIILFSKKNKLSKELTDVNINNICNNTKMIVVNAYDGEGYVFWEKIKVHNP